MKIDLIELVTKDIGLHHLYKQVDNKCHLDDGSPSYADEDLLKKSLEDIKFNKLEK